MQAQPSGFRLVFRANWQKSEGWNRAEQSDQASAQSRIGRGGIGRTLPVAALAPVAVGLNGSGIYIATALGAADLVPLPAMFADLRAD